MKSANIFELPNFTLVSASAGSGKTYELTKRFIQLLLSSSVPNNNLKNILAITFTNNAALEMKQRVLDSLKKISFGDQDALKNIREVVDLENDRLIEIAKNKVDYILDNYSDFQVQTIDSFLSRVIQSAAIDFGLPPSFEIILDSKKIIDEAFEELSRELGKDDVRRSYFLQIVDIIVHNQGDDSRFLWNPYFKLSKEVKSVYKKISSHAGELPENGKNDLMEKLRSEIPRKLIEIDNIVKENNFQYGNNYQKIIEAAKAGKFNSFIDKKLSQKILKYSLDKNFQTVSAKIEKIQEEVVNLQSEYFLIKAFNHYQPFVKTQKQLIKIVENVCRRRSEVAFSDATKMLASRILEMNLPEIYFSLGEQIYHFLIDEFQDTSPIQWAALRPLIEESLSKSGSLFLVGDTKQAIFTFRGGDWQIMARMNEKEEFSSVKCSRVKLSFNYRSSEAVVKFVEKVFHEIAPQQIDEAVMDQSGLLSYDQSVSSKGRGKGYVEVRKFEKPEEKTECPLERQIILDTIHDCINRKYNLGDIAILTPRNQDAVNVSSWLSAEGIKFLSHSSLDIRKRKIICEILSLLKFLDSPIDDLSFAEFLLSDVFSKELSSKNISLNFHDFIFEWRKEKKQGLYIKFRDKYPDLWGSNFENLFSSVGYLPIYDLIAEICNQFNLYDNFSNEQATLVKFLEVVSMLEGKGGLSLKDFLSASEEQSEDEQWNIPVPSSEDAVTIMTIHKAKGLGFPIVITLFYDSMPNYDSMVVAENENIVQLFHITKNESSFNQKLDEMYKVKESRRIIDEMNKLYVALTRAENEMYVISIMNKYKSTSKFLPDDGFTIGKKTYKEKLEKAKENEAQIIFPRTRGISQAREMKKIGLEEVMRGEFIHDVLAQIVFVGDAIEEQVSKAVENVKFKYPPIENLDDVINRLCKFISLPDITDCFTEKPGRKVFVEQEITDKHGMLFRIDRIIVDSNKITVIDYKTGEESDEYINQVKKYIEVLSEKYLGVETQGLIAYVDLGIVKKIL